MSNTEQEVDFVNEIHKVIKKTFKNSTSGYCWIIAKFGIAWRGKLETIQDVYACVGSKQLQTECPVHGRIHDNKKRMKKWNAK